MLMKLTTLITLALFINFVINCSISEAANINEIIEISSSNKIKAKKFPKVKITTFVKEPQMIQRIIKVIPGYVLIDSEMEIGELNDIVKVKRKIGNEVKTIGQVQIVKFQKGKTAAKIMREEKGMQIKIGDYVGVIRIKSNNVVTQTFTSKARQSRGKIISLEEENVIFLPYPYWNVEPIRIDLNEIYTIKITKKDNKVGKGLGWGFALGFIIPGAVGGVLSENDLGYAVSLFGSIIIGLLGGILGLIIGGVSSIDSKSKYNLHMMSKQEKINTILEIMGV